MSAVVTPTPPASSTAIAKPRAPCERLTLDLDKGLRKGEVESIRGALALKSQEVIISIYYANHRHSRLEVTTNFGTECLTYGSVYTFVWTKTGWRWLRNIAGGVVY